MSETPRGVVGPPRPSRAENRSRLIFREINRLMVLMWRFGWGPWLNIWPSGSGRILVLGHIGRLSGRRRFTPLNYAEVAGQIYVTAGFGPTSHWYRNLLEHPWVEVWLPSRRLHALAQDISDRPDRVHLMRQVLIASGFAAQLAGIDPRRLDDASLDTLTSTYRLIELSPQPAPELALSGASGASGAGGAQPSVPTQLPEHPRPGDLAPAGWAVLLLGLLGIGAAVRRFGQR